MARYFETFPKLLYDIDNTKNFKIVTDIFRRIKVREQLKTNAALFSKYSVPSGEQPETTSYKHFGTTDYFWIILLLNDITDRYYGWPLSIQEFEQYIYNKYDNPEAVHHYEITTQSGRTTSNGPNDYSHLVECNSDDGDPDIITNRQYEQRKQDEYRQIRLLNRKFVDIFVDEFELLIKQ